MIEALQLNYWAIGVSTLAGFALVGLWYGPLFGSAWLNAMGKRAEDLTPSATPFVVSFFTALLTALVLAGLIRSLGITGMIDGMLLGLITGVGFIAAAMASDTAFCGWGMRLFLIQSGYRVSYSIVMGAVLGAWQ